MEITYSIGPRFIDGNNIDIDVEAVVVESEIEREIDAPVTGLTGPGYEPGQLNRSGDPL